MSNGADQAAFLESLRAIDDTLFPGVSAVEEDVSQEAGRWRLRVQVGLLAEGSPLEVFVSGPRDEQAGEGPGWLEFSADGDRRLEPSPHLLKSILIANGEGSFGARAAYLPDQQIVRHSVEVYLDGSATSGAAEPRFLASAIAWLLNNVLRFRRVFFGPASGLPASVVKRITESCNDRIDEIRSAAPWSGIAATALEPARLRELVESAAPLPAVGSVGTQDDSMVVTEIHGPEGPLTALFAHSLSSMPFVHRFATVPLAPLAVLGFGMPILLKLTDPDFIRAPGRTAWAPSSEGGGELMAFSDLILPPGGAPEPPMELLDFAIGSHVKAVAAVDLIAFRERLAELESSIGKEACLESFRERLGEWKRLIGES